MNAWTLRKETPLLDLLRQDGVLSEGDHDALSHLVERHLARHGGDAQKSLAAVPLDAAIRSLIEEKKNPGPGTGHNSMATTAPTVLRATTPTTGSTLADGPRFRRVRSHAKGGLGEVWLAEDAELHREVALKEIQERFADYEDSRTRFVREAEITGQLEHPGVVPIYGLGSYGDGRPYYAMRFIRGESMQEAIDRLHEADRAERDPGERALALRGLLGRFVAVCNAVGYAHARGTIHRDLKPGNVMLGEFGETLVVDWGLARRMNEEEDRTLLPIPIRLSQDAVQTLEGQSLGTPSFMPPEQALGEMGRVGPASDIFSLGATLYCLLTGKPPYRGSNLVLQAAECRYPVPRQVNTAVPAALEAVCVKAMARRPEDRYAQARDLAAEVDRWLGDEPVSAYRESLMPRVGRWARRHRTLVSSLLVLLLASVTGSTVGLIVVGREQVRTADALTRALGAEKEAKDNLLHAEDNLNLARKAVDECYNIAKEHPRFQEEGLKDVKKLLMEKALPFYKNFRSQRPDDPKLDEETDAQIDRVAYILNEIGAKDELTNYLQALGKEKNDRIRKYFSQTLGKEKGTLESIRLVRDIFGKLAEVGSDGSPDRLDVAGNDFNLACIHALLSVQVRKNLKRPLALRNQESEKLEREAMHHLERAKVNGWFAVPANRQQLDKETDLDSLRNRAGFKAFLAALPKSP